jgi:hypothetical protein
VKVLDFREKLKEALDEALDAVLLYKTHEEGLDAGADIFEELIAEEVGKIVTTMVLGMSTDLSKVQNQLLKDLDPIRERKKKRQEALEKMSNSVSDNPI